MQPQDSKIQPAPEIKNPTVADVNIGKGIPNGEASIKQSGTTEVSSPRLLNPTPDTHIPTLTGVQTDKVPTPPVVDPNTKVGTEGSQITASTQSVEYEYPPGVSKLKESSPISPDADTNTRSFEAAMSKLTDIRDTKMEAIKQSEEALEKGLGPIQKMFELVESNGGSDMMGAFVDFAKLIADNSEARDILKKALEEDLSDKSLW